MCLLWNSFRCTNGLMPFANIQTCYLLNYSIKIKLVTEKGNGRNEIWTLKKTRNWSSCTKVAPSVSCTHDLFVCWWPELMTWYIHIYIDIYVSVCVRIYWSGLFLFNFHIFYVYQLLYVFYISYIHTYIHIYIHIYI